MTVTDDDTGTRTITKAVTVHNVAPGAHRSAATPASLDEGQSTPVTVSGTFTDPGPLDTHVVTIDWGAGWAPAERTQTDHRGPGRRPTFSAQRRYGDDSSYTITATVRDDDTGQDMEHAGACPVRSVNPTVAIDDSAAAGARSVVGVQTFIGTIRWVLPFTGRRPTPAATTSPSGGASTTGRPTARSSAWWPRRRDARPSPQGRPAVGDRRHHPRLDRSVPLRPHLRRDRRRRRGRRPPTTPW